MSAEKASFSGRLGRFASFNVAQHLWLAAVSLFATPILYHRLGEAAYGILSVVNLAAAQLSVIEFGFGHATIRRVAQCRAVDDDAGLARTLATSSWVFMTTAAIGGLTLFAAADFLTERYFEIPPELLDTGTTALRMGALFLVFSMLGNLASSVWAGLQRFGWLASVSAGAATLQLLGSVALVFMGYGILHVLSWTILLGAGTLLLHFVRLRRTEPRVRLFGRPDKGAFREMATFGFLLMLAGILNQLVVSGGALVLGHFVLVGALPFFTVPFGLFQRLKRMGSGLASALYPLVAELDELRDHESLQRIFRSGTRILLLGAAAAMGPAVLLATPFLTLWMGAEFAAQAGPVLEVLFVIFAVALSTIPSIELSRGRGNASWLVVYTGIMAFINVVAVALLAPVSGALGAAWGLLLAQTGGTVFLLVRVGGSNCLRILSLRATAIVVSAVAATVWLLEGTVDPLVRLGAAVLLGAAVAGAGLAWGLDSSDRTVLARMARRT